MRRRKVWSKFSFALLLGVIAGLLLAPGTAQASVWTDISDSQWQSSYGVTAAQVDSVADGFLDGTFRPAASVTRGQFAKMAVLGLSVASASPATPTFTDVPKTQTFYIYVEGAAAANLVQGIDGTHFSPQRQISREQAATILARYLSAAELQKLGYIAGSNGAKYTSLTAWYSAEGQTALSAFTDAGSISETHRPGLAYLVARSVTQGSNGRLNPSSAISRAQSAVMILRVAQTASNLGTGTTSKVPTVTSLSPSTGSANGGDTVTIYGTNFTSSAIVMFGTATVGSANFTFNSSTQLTVVTPAGTGAVHVRVTTADGTTALTSADLFTYQGSAGPTITAVSPSSGNPLGGDTITILGTGFTTGTQVMFGSTVVDSSKVTFVNSTQLTVISPAGTDGTTVSIQVTTSSGSSPDTSLDDFTFKETSVPTITDLTPAAGSASGGTTVVITGTNFVPGADVYFGAQQVSSGSISVNSSTRVTVTSPAGTDGQTVRVKMVTSAGPSADTLADDYSYGAPTVTGINPGQGDPAGGDTITITGTGFSGDMTAQFGSVSADSTKIKVISPTQMTVVSPAGTDGDIVDIIVGNAYGKSAATAADQFTYGLPSITSLSPAAGDPDGGDSVVITGTDFVGVTAVFFGGVELSSSNYTVDSRTQITATAPAGTAGVTVRVKVVCAAGTTPDTLADDYSFGAPTVTAISPNHGAASGGDYVFITGTGFSGHVTVSFGGVAIPSSSVLLASPTRLRVSTPEGTVGTSVDVQVENDFDISAANGNDVFTYLDAAAPEITSISPDSGVPSGGDTVYIIGQNFEDGSIVKFDGVALASSKVTYNYATMLTIVTPAGVGGHVAKVTVTTSEGTSNEYDFTYADDTGSPTITKLTPNVGDAAGGDTLVITGTHFSADSVVEFDDVAVEDTYVTVNSSTKITVITPGGAVGHTAEVTVTTDVGTSNALGFTYLAADSPTITSLSAYSGDHDGGTYVTIKGANFTDTATVEIDGVAIDSSRVTFVSSTRIVVQMPAGTIGTVEITVTTAAGTSNPVEFTYI